MKKLSIEYRCFLALLVFALSTVSIAQNLDVLIVNGQIHDGSGEPPFPGVVAIKDERIVYVGPAKGAPESAAAVIDANGLPVVPGFIDPHTHALVDLRSERRRQNVNYLTQGVTTVFVGNDGGGKPHVAELAAELEANGIGPNVAFFVGHGELRTSVMGLENRAPTAAEMAQMGQLLQASMDEGALGLSTGLYYSPGSYATTDEVIALAQIASRAGGIYESHLRDESSYTIGFLAALEEAIDIGRRADIPVHIGHIKALGVDVWGQSEQAIKMIVSAREEGIQVTADQYPWEASGTHLRNALVPGWALADSNEKYQQRLRDPDTLARIKPAVAENIRRRGGPQALLVATCPDARFAGKTLADAAQTLQLSATDAAIHLLSLGSSRVISFNMQAEDIENFMRQDWVMTSSDGIDQHPRKYASFPQKFSQYVQGRELMSVAAFVHRSSGLTAKTFGLEHRGFLREGYFADIAVIDPKTFAARADYLNWNRLSTGVQHLFVNGQAVIREGEVLPVLAGRPLEKSSGP